MARKAAVKVADEVVELNDNWHGMFSAWGQEGRDWSIGACFGYVQNEPKRFWALGEDKPNVQSMGVRTCSLDMSMWWLNYVLENMIPEELRAKMTFTRIMSKADFPRKFTAGIMKRSVYTPDENPGDVDDWEQEAAGKYAKAIPWLLCSFEQTLTFNDFFVASVLLRATSEHVRLIKLMQVMPRLFPELPINVHYPIAQNLSGARGHAVGGFGFVTYPGAVPGLLSFNFKDSWRRMNKDLPKTIAQAATKHKHIDGYFGPLPPKKDSIPNYWPKGNELYGEADVPLQTLTRNGIALKHRHNDVRAFLNPILKHFGAKEISYE